MQGIKSRFEQDGMVFINTLEDIICTPSTGYADSLKLLCLQYNLNFDDVNTELSIIHKDSSLTNCHTLIDFINLFKQNLSCNRALYSNIFNLITMAILLPATNATSERSFSGLKRLKSALRSSMGQQRMNNLLLLHVYKEQTDALDVQELISQFVKCHSRREKCIAVKV